MSWFNCCSKMGWLTWFFVGFYLSTVSILQSKKNRMSKNDNASTIFDDKTQHNNNSIHFFLTYQPHTFCVALDAERWCKHHFWQQCNTDMTQCQQFGRQQFLTSPTAPNDNMVTIFAKTQCQCNKWHALHFLWWHITILLVRRQLFLMTMQKTKVKKEDNSGKRQHELHFFVNIIPMQKRTWTPYFATL